MVTSSSRKSETAHQSYLKRLSSNINTFQQYHQVQHLFWQQQQQHLCLHDDPILSHNVSFPVRCVSPSYIPASPIMLIPWSSKSVMWNLKFNQSVLLPTLVYLPWKIKHKWAHALPFLYHVTCPQRLNVQSLDGNHNLHSEVPTLICQLQD